MTLQDLLIFQENVIFYFCTLSQRVSFLFSNITELMHGQLPGTDVIELHILPENTNTEPIRIK